MKSFEEFKNEVIGRIKEFLPESYEAADISTHHVRKNNNLILTGLNIKTDDSNICPTIYLQKFYDEYVEGVDMSEILERIAQVRMDHDVKSFDVAQITDFEQVKGKLVPCIINARMNSELLEARPHKLIADLAVTYRALLGQSFDGTASVAVTNELMEKWSVSLEELHEIALANLSKLLPSTFKGMTEVMSEMMDMSTQDMEMMGLLPTKEEQMYVLTNLTKVNGASALLDTKMMKEIIEKIGDFYILPSSVHEVLVVPVKSGMDVATLEAMVRDVNSTQLQQDEILSNRVYSYSLKEGLKIAA